MPLISVIIPVYNGEKTIKETIDSVLNQTFSDFELIVINDGSQDATLDIISSYKDHRIHIFNFANAGQPASRNRGISLAKGEYISFIDADDIWTKDKLEAQLKQLQNNPQAAVAYSWTNWIDNNGKFLGRGMYRTENGNVYEKLLFINFIASGSNPLIKRQALDAVGSFDESLTNAHDWDMWLRLAIKYDFVAVESPQILYRQSANSMSSNVLGMEASSLQVVEKNFANAPESLRNLKQKVIGSRYEYLTYKALEWPLTRSKGLVAIRFFLLAVSSSPAMMFRVKIILIVVFKIAVAVLLPTQLSQSLLAIVKNILKK